MDRRLLLVLAAGLAWSLPASAEIVIDQAEVSGGALVVSGQVSRPVRQVTLNLGATSAIQLQPDWTGRFAWIGGQIPPSCAVSVDAGAERADAGIGRCGGGTPPYPVPTGVAASGYQTSYYGSSESTSRVYPAPGAGVESQTATRSTTQSTVQSTGQSTTRTTTTTVRVRPLFISPNEPRYAQAEPPHGGEPPVQGANSGERYYPEHGFYATLRSKDGAP